MFSFRLAFYPTLNFNMISLPISLRSKPFQSSYCANVTAGAKKRKGEEDFFCSRPNFLDELARKRLLCRLLLIYYIYSLGLGKKLIVISPCTVSI